MHPAFQRQMLRAHPTISKGLSVYILSFVFLLFPSRVAVLVHISLCQMRACISLSHYPLFAPLLSFCFNQDRKKAKPLIAHDPSHHFWGSQKQNSSLCAWRDLQKVLAFDRNDAQS